MASCIFKSYVFVYSGQAARTVKSNFNQVLNS